MTELLSRPAPAARTVPHAARALAILAALWMCAPATAGETVVADARITSTARLLAGVGSAYEPHAHIAALGAWQKHR